MNRRYTDDELERLVQDANERAHGGRLERLRLLLSKEDPELVPTDGLAHEYYEEARLCWYMGAFVATIVMSQLAFEEMLRSHYRVMKCIDKNLLDRKKVDEVSFADLVEQAKDDGFLSQEEATALHKMRKDYRNPYVHPHDYAPHDFFTQHMKIVAPQLFGTGAEDEARETITLLVALFRKISHRLWGRNLGGMK